MDQSSAVSAVSPVITDTQSSPKTPVAPPKGDLSGRRAVELTGERAALCAVYTKIWAAAQETTLKHLEDGEKLKGRVQENLNDLAEIVITSGMLVSKQETTLQAYLSGSYKIAPEDKTKYDKFVEEEGQIAKKAISIQEEAQKLIKELESLIVCHGKAAPSSRSLLEVHNKTGLTEGDFSTVSAYWKKFRIEWINRKVELTSNLKKSEENLEVAKNLLKQLNQHVNPAPTYTQQFKGAVSGLSTFGYSWFSSKPSTEAAKQAPKQEEPKPVEKAVETTEEPKPVEKAAETTEKFTITVEPAAEKAV